MMSAAKAVYDDSRRRHTTPLAVFLERPRLFALYCFILLVVFNCALLWFDVKDSLTSKFQDQQGTTEIQPNSLFTPPSPHQALLPPHSDPSLQSTTSIDEVDVPVELTTALPFNLKLSILKNPYDLSLSQITEQMETAKIPALKKKVKRFACWHSCFGQFKKKAVRIMYGDPVSIPVTLKTTTTTTTEAPPGKKEEKREIKWETTTALPAEEYIKRKDDEPTPKRIPNYFKLKTNFVTAGDPQNDKLAAKVKVVSTSNLASTDDEQKEAVDLKKAHSGITESSDAVSKGTPPKEKDKPKSDAKYEVTEEEFDSVEMGVNERGKEESGSSEESGSVSGSGEDKGDGIDKKDLAEEDKI